MLQFGSTAVAQTDNGEGLAGSQMTKVRLFFETTKYIIGKEFGSASFSVVMMIAVVPHRNHSYSLIPCDLVKTNIILL